MKEFKLWQLDEMQRIYLRFYSTLLCKFSVWIRSLLGSDISRHFYHSQARMTVTLNTPFSSFPSWGLRREAIFIIFIQIQYDTMTAMSLQQILNISMFKQDLSIFTRRVWCAINTRMCNNFPAFLWASKRAPGKGRDKWVWSLKEDFSKQFGV